ncbi:MAG: hypothetical protein ACM3ML_25610 [Micromonosporaceae bacterium]
MIKIRYADLPEGLHVDVRSEGRTTVIYLLPALSRPQWRAALTKARQAALVGRSPNLPLIPLALAICADRSRTTLRAAAAAARVHPVGFAVPSAILITAVVLYTFVSSVTIHLAQPPQAAGPGGRPPVISGSQGALGGQQPQPGASASSGAVGGAIGSPAGPSGGGPGQGGPSSPAGPSSQPSSPVTPPSGPDPTSSPIPSGPSPAPSPTPTGNGNGNGGLCVKIGPLQVCANLR